jgi:hypothetical protein
MENRRRELAGNQRLHLNEDLKLSDREARFGFLCSTKLKDFVFSTGLFEQEKTEGTENPLN